MKNCSTSLIVTEVQIQTSMRHQLNICQSVHHEQINKQQVFVRLWRKEIPPELLVGMQSNATTLENDIQS